MERIILKDLAEELGDLYEAYDRDIYSDINERRYLMHYYDNAQLKSWKDFDDYQEALDYAVTLKNDIEELSERLNPVFYVSERADGNTMAQCWYRHRGKREKIQVYVGKTENFKKVTKKVINEKAKELIRKKIQQMHPLSV